MENNSVVLSERRSPTNRIKIILPNRNSQKFDSTVLGREKKRKTRFTISSRHERNKLPRNSGDMQILSEYTRRKSTAKI